MKGSLTLIKPIKQRSKSAITKNMFQDPELIEQMPVTSRENIEHYDIVGPPEFRKKFLNKPAPLKLDHSKVQPVSEHVPFNQTVNSKTPFNTTINRDTMLSSLHKTQQIQFTKQIRNLQKYKQYQTQWQQQKLYIQSSLQQADPLMDKNIKPLYVHPNEKKNDTINDYIVHYWEMSLRNNNPILERHIKGHHFSKVEKEKLLQLKEGTKKVENSIPLLPLDKINQLKRRELSLGGKNKVKQQLEHPQNQTHYSLPATARLSQQQVLKINYDGDKKWMGLQNL